VQIYFMPAVKVSTPRLPVYEYIVLEIGGKTRIFRLSY